MNDQPKWPVAIYFVVIFVLALMAFSCRDARATEALSMETVTAQSDIVGALTCQRRGWTWFVRLSPEHVLCLPSNVGIKGAIEISAFLHRQ